jgi:hypothetical protein
LLPKSGGDLGHSPVGMNVEKIRGQRTIRAPILTTNQWSLSTPKAQAKSPPNPTSNPLEIHVLLEPPHPAV